MSDVDFKAAMEHASRWYAGIVNDLAERALAELRDAGPEDPWDWLNDWLYEECNDHEVVIYLLRARMVAVTSNNSSAWEDVAEEWPGDSAVAFYALTADVRDNLQRRDLDGWVHRVDHR